MPIPMVQMWPTNTKNHISYVTAQSHNTHINITTGPVHSHKYLCSTTFFANITHQHDNQRNSEAYCHACYLVGLLWTAWNCVFFSLTDLSVTQWSLPLKQVSIGPPYKTDHLHLCCNGVDKKHNMCPFCCKSQNKGAKLSCRVSRIECCISICLLIRAAL